MPQPIVPNLWFDGNAEEAAEFYLTVFPNSTIRHVARYTDAGPGPAGTVMTIDFELDGQRFIGINGGPQFPFSEAVSFMIPCDDQQQVDYYWDRLTADGGREGQCGWCKDKFGVSWQVVPPGMEAIFANPDPAAAERAMTVMFGMKKLIKAELEAAAAGQAVS